MQEASETVLQEFEIPLCHFLKDDLIVIASKFLGRWPDGFEALRSSNAFPMFATFLYPECLHSSTDLFDNIFIRAFTMAADRLLREQEGIWNGGFSPMAPRACVLSG